MKKTKAKSSAVQTVAMMMAVTVLAKILGLLRGMMLAWRCGTTESAAAFLAAQRIPLSLFDMLFSAAVVGSFVPMYSRLSKDREKAAHFASSFLLAVLGSSAAAALLGSFLASPLISLVAPSLTAEAHALATGLLTVLFPLVLFAGATYTVIGILQAHGRFLVPALVSAFSNVLVILFFLVYPHEMNGSAMYVLAAVVSLSWTVQLLTLVPSLHKTGFRLRFARPIFSQEVRAVLRRAPAVTVASWLLPASSLIGTHFASRSGAVGAIGAFEYASALYFMAAGVVTYSLCNFALPRMARADGGDLRVLILRGVYVLFLIAVPTAGTLYVLSEEVVCVLYLRGSFTAQDARAVSSLLRLISTALPLYAVGEFLSRAFFAEGKVRIPAIAAAVSTAGNVAVTALLLRAGAGLASVGIGSAVGQGFYFLFLSCAAVRTFALRKTAFFRKAIAVVTPGVLFGFTLFLADRLFGGDPYTRPLLGNLGFAAGALGASAPIYFISIYVLRRFDARKSQ